LLLLLVLMRLFLTVRRLYVKKLSQGLSQLQEEITILDQEREDIKNLIYKIASFKGFPSFGKPFFISSYKDVVVDFVIFCNFAC